MDIVLWLLDWVSAPQPDVLFGFLGGLFGSKPKKPKQSENDKALAEVSQKQFDRYQRRFAPLTGELDELSKQDKTETLRGRGNADVMRSLGSARAPGANGQIPSAERTGTRALGSALTGGTAANTDRQQRLTKGVMDSAMGSNQSAIQGLGAATQMNNQRAIQKMRIDQANGRLAQDALGTAAGAALAFGMKPSASGGKPPPARDSVFTIQDTGNGMRDHRTLFSGVGL